MSQAERLYWIDAEIRGGRYPNPEALREKFGIRRRQAYGDRRCLVQMNAPLVFDQKHGGWTYSDPTYVLPFLHLSRRETAGLRRALLAAREYLGAEDARALEIVAERLAPDLAPVDRESVSGAVHPAGSVSIPPGLLAA